jgi:Uma2 family endonuclease
MSVVAYPRPKESTDDGRFQWTVDAFYRASAGGVFNEPKQWELVNGELWKKDPVNPPHAETTGRIADMFRDSFARRFRIREEKPIHLSMYSEPVPDVAVVVARNEGYGDRHLGPDEIALIVEVADTSVHRDTVEKVLLYAQAGIADYWVSLIPTRELLVFRSPTSEGYLESACLSETDYIRPLAAPDVEFAVRDLIVPISNSTTENAAD